MRSEVVTLPKATDPGTVTREALCDDHGPFTQKTIKILNSTFETECPSCVTIRKEAEKAAEIAQAALEAKNRMERKLGAALIPKRFAGRTLDGYTVENEDQKEALRICRKYAAVFPEIYKAGRCLLLLGKPGTGKTHLAVGIANEIMRTSAFTAVYRTVGSLLQAIRGSYDKSGTQNEAQILAGMIEPSLLILDEIGVSKEKPSDFELTTLFAVINGRYEQQRPTVIISNLDAEHLPMAMGDRCVDRLREGGGIAVKFDWESQRGKEFF